MVHDAAPGGSAAEPPVETHEHHRGYQRGDAHLRLYEHQDDEVDQPDDSGQYGERAPPVTIRVVAHGDAHRQRYGRWYEENRPAHKGAQPHLLTHVERQDVQRTHVDHVDYGERHDGEIQVTDPEHPHIQKRMVRPSADDTEGNDQQNRGHTGHNAEKAVLRIRHALQRDDSESYRHKEQERAQIIHMNPLGFLPGKADRTQDDTRDPYGDVYQEYPMPCRVLKNESAHHRT